MTLCFYHCVTISHLQSWSMFSWEGWDSGCLRCGWGLKPAEMVWAVSTFLSANAANRWNKPPTLPLVQQRLHIIDRIVYLGRNLGFAYIHVFMRPCACVHHSAFYLEDWWVEYLIVDESFFSRGKETSKCDKANESALSFKWTSPLKVDPAVHLWPISFNFTTLKVTPYCQASCYLV